jgi:hypothetical protein
MSAPTRPTKITFAEMRTAGVRGVLIYCSDYKCSHSTAISADQWPDHVRLSDLEARFVCKACGKRGADVRPDFNWNKAPRRARPLGNSFADCESFRSVGDRPD